MARPKILKGHSHEKILPYLVRSECLYFFEDFSYYTLSDESDVFEVKLNKIETSFSTTRMQILRHVIDMWAEVVGITIT